MSGVAHVGELAAQVRGVSYKKEDASNHPTDTTVGVLRAGNIKDGELVLDDLVYVPDHCVSSQQMLRRGDVLIATSSGSIDIVGKAARVREDQPLAFGAFCKVLRPTDRVDHEYFANFFQTIDYRRYVSRVAAGANINNLKNSHLDDIEILLPPLEEQKRIASILDTADELRTKRQQAITQLDTLTQAIFHDMFGDPILNQLGWPQSSLGTLAVKFSDGPFGSNLKSDHYVDEGVRVIRLQNIGVGELVDDDRAYISHDHFAQLMKHECLPGDVLVGTLGDPNLRACIQPDWLAVALNKADCVQIRVDETVAVGEWLCALLNCPATGVKAQSLVKGQTRARISMGRLRELHVPVPPLSLQLEFAETIQTFQVDQIQQQHSVEALDSLFASLQQRAFRGDL